MIENINLQSINIVWFKRDLRLQDHLPLCSALESELSVLLLYFFEPSIIKAPESSHRHWRFVWQSIEDINQQLSRFNTHLKLHILHQEVETAFDELQRFYDIKTVFSHQETGLSVTYERDKSFKKYCQQHNIIWKEYQCNGVIRGLKNRSNWNKDWLDFMQQPQHQPNWKHVKTVRLPSSLNSVCSLNDIFQPTYDDTTLFQPGGEYYANKYLSSFLESRIRNYSFHISKPLESRTGCSRLSPYLAWGNLSVRQVFQATKAQLTNSNLKRQLNNFNSRLFWHCHFIQKFESEERIEFENLNSAFDNLRTINNQAYFNAWQTGHTGYPLVDACMRCVVATGYINFRMRAMLVSFLTHNLWQHWKDGAIHLAQQFLDFEPGIHYAQFQMQAGTMGVNTIRTYNPVKQSKDHDPNGIFIKQWLPELRNVPDTLIHEPWLMTDMEQQLFHCVIGKDYPAPIVDLKITARYAAQQLWGTKKSALARANNQTILEKHVKKSLSEN